MTRMTVRMFYEPKNPRCEDDYISDLEDDDEKRFDEKPRKRKTSTQALAEFLNNTSPEEFQKNSNTIKRPPSTSFFRRKVPANNTKSNKERNSILQNQGRATNATLRSPHLLLYRKNYIEILANPFMIKKETKRTTAPHTSSDIGSNLNRKLSISASSYTSSFFQEIESELPNFRNGPNLLLQLPPKSMFQHDITSHHHHQHHQCIPITTSTATSTRSPLVFLNDSSRRTSIDKNSTISKRTKRTSSQDIIEQGLLQRLKLHNAVNQTEKPSDLISNALAQEHLQALSVSASTSQEKEKVFPNPKRVRHMQVQTIHTTTEEEPTKQQQESEEEKEIDTDKVKEKSKPKKEAKSVSEEEKNVFQRLELLEQELKHEKMIRQRLEAALEDACDHFEVLSGLAYKKIRELWEDRSRWENACLQVKEQCWSDHQQQILGSSTKAEGEEGGEEMPPADHQIESDGKMVPDLSFTEGKTQLN